jgi:hypothetical protein
MPYGYLLLIATVVLAVRHVRAAYASSRSQYLVGSVAAVSVLAPYLWPRFLPLAALVPLVSLCLQFAVCFYVIFYQVAWGSGDEGAKLSQTLSRTQETAGPRAEDEPVQGHSK